MLDKVMEEKRRKFQKRIYVNESVPVSTVDDWKAVSSFSLLPGDVIHRIFSFLPGKEAAATVTLSKTCQEQCPVMNFDESFYSYGKEMELWEEKCRLFIKTVDDSLSRFCPQDRTRKAVRFCITNKSVLLGRMKEWLELVRIKKFTDLYLDVQQFYCLPETIFALRSLTVLHLKGCALPDMGLKECSILYSLRELHLTNVSRVGTLIHHLGYFCPSIVNFSLIWCSGFGVNWDSEFDDFILSGLDKLTEVNVKDGDNIGCIMINTRSLRIFRLCSRRDHMLLDIDMNICRNLEVLHLNVLPSILGLSRDICSQFPFLKTLSLGSSGSSARFKIASPVLQILELVNTDFVLDSVIDTPNLQSFRYMNYYRFIGLDLDAFTAMAPKPQEIKIKLWCSDWCVYTSWFLQLRTFIQKLPSKCVKLSIILDSAKVKFEHEELGDVGMFSLPPRVNLLKLKIKSEQENCSKLVDGFLWSCRPDTLTVKSPNTLIRKKFVEALCNEFTYKGRKRHCCRSNHIRCWRHYMKDDFEIEQLFGAQHLKTNFSLKW